MKLHTSVIEKIIQIYDNYGGFTNQNKLREHLNRLDLTPYERKHSPNGEVILVTTEEYMKQLNKKQ